MVGDAAIGILHAEHDPVFARRDVVEHPGTVIAIDDDDIEAAVVVQIAEGRRPAGGDQGCSSAARWTEWLKAA